MTIREASVAWDYPEKQIRELCQYQFIPMAEKKRIGWVIPDDAEKPPVKTNAFIVLMESIAEIKEGGNPNVCRKGLPKDKVKDALYYLSGFGFITGYDENLEYQEILQGASLLEKSYPVINRYRRKNNLPDIEVNRGAELNVGGLGKIHTEKRVSY